jgi:nucleoside-diphosphate-sugar epimerase
VIRNKLFCFGLGYAAQVLAQRLSAQGWLVAGTCRSEEQAGALRSAGFAAYIFDRDRPLVPDNHPVSPEALEKTTHVLVSVPPDAEGDPVIARHWADLAALKDLRWLGYLSTTGVYGSRDGGWVDEASELHPTSERSRWRVAAEAAWDQLRQVEGLPAHIFRLAGIYGPDRSAFDALRDGTARRIDAGSQVFSRIHVDDIANALIASMAKPRPGAIYNVCDDQPAAQADVVAHAAKLLGVPPPPLISLAEANLSPMARSFYADNKRVSNALIKQELGVTLAYPDYRAGLVAILAAGG